MKMRILLLMTAMIMMLPPGARAQIDPAMLMSVTSTEFSEGATIPREYTCEGRDISPPLRIDRTPEATQSLVIIMEDIDAPNPPFTHWLAWNIDPSRTQFIEGVIPDEVVEGRNDFGARGYRGPCPPAGVHRYYFRVYALDTTLDLPAGSSRRQLEAAMKHHVLKEAALMGKFSRSAGSAP